MASISRISSRNFLHKLISKHNQIRVASITTSKKDKDTSITTTPNLFDNGALPEQFDAKVTQKTWVSWGWDTEDVEHDRTFIHLFMFGFCTIFTLGGYYIMYAPPKRLRDWAQREAYLQIRYREQNGLPYVNRDVVPAENVVLPTDEELGHTEIII